MSLIAVAEAGPVEPDAVRFAAARLSSVLGLETRQLEPFPDPAYAYDTARGQYSSTLVLRDSLARKPADAERLLVLTERDIFIPMLSFVYGQAQLGGPVALMSLARLRPEFYGMAPNRPLLLDRVGKEALHEFGHTLGLTHCDEPRCTMRLSTNIEQLDDKGNGYCGSCTILLREAAAATAGAEVSGGAT